MRRVAEVEMRARRYARLFAPLCALIALSASGSVVAAELTDDEPPRVRAAGDVVEGGTHWRFVTSDGPVHVWTPWSYDRATAGIVVYVHGYYTDVDQAWRAHRLAQQFRDSKKNAVFIVPEAPVSDREAVHYKNLGALLELTSRAMGERLPSGPLVAMGHSGAFRTILEWLASDRIDQVMIIDGLYLAEEDFGTWLGQRSKRRPRKMVLVSGRDTMPRSEVLARRYAREHVRRPLPTSMAEIGPAERLARLVYFPAEGLDHMGVVTDGKIIPLVLQLAPFPRT